MLSGLQCRQDPHTNCRPASMLGSDLEALKAAY